MVKEAVSIAGKPVGGSVVNATFDIRASEGMSCGPDAESTVYSKECTVEAAKGAVMVHCMLVITEMSLDAFLSASDDDTI